MFGHFSTLCMQGLKGCVNIKINIICSNKKGLVYKFNIPTEFEQLFDVYYLQLNVDCLVRRDYLVSCPNTELFLVRIQENADQKRLRNWTLFTHWISLMV